MKRTLFVCASFLLAAALWAGEAPGIITSSADLTRIKNLVGTWKGQTEMHGKPTDITVKFVLTAGGSAVVETDFPGTPQEMTTIYSDEGGKAAVTHYCMAGNHPHMSLVKSTRDSLAFEMKDNRGLRSPKEDHMHALVLSIPDSNSLIQTWTNYKDGKKGDTVVFRLLRSPAYEP